MGGDLKEKNAIIIFTKNPEKGKVKTRLAQTIGNDKALYIYTILLHYTSSVTSQCNATRVVYFSDRLGDNQFFHDFLFKKNIQKGKDLGEKMYHAFEDLFKLNFERILIVGCDCYEITHEIINDAFTKLEIYDSVIGPAHDGGFYLLGIKQLKTELFLNKEWSTERVCEEAIQVFNHLNWTYFTLPILTDIDYEKDLGELKKYL